MPNLPQDFRKASEIGVSYDFSDIQSGTGYNAYYGAQMKDSGATTQFLTSTEGLYSAVESVTTGGTTAFNFDLSAFNMPMVVKGIAILSCCAVHSAATGHITAAIQKLSGGTATTIGATITGADVATSPVMHLFKWSISETHFKKGDILRLVLTLVTGSGTFYVGTDSGNVKSAPLDTAPTTELKLLIPFKLDL